MRLRLYLFPSFVLIYLPPINLYSSKTLKSYIELVTAKL